ncbi:hypothetical protein BGW42_005012 [Actinomortierella wolfii]|nr:hypothetical protein BGW42_005012 [Actinomortierella wolfii]
MSDLPRILSRLVQEGLRGPFHRPEQSKSINPATNDREHHQPNIIERDPDWNDPRWKVLFDEFFVSDHLDDRHDDLLFFVQRGKVENGGKGADPVFVKRKVQGHKRILTPEQEQVVLWKDTFFLNVIVQLHCKLTVAVCNRVAETNPLTGVTKTSMTCTRKHVSKRVYASPTKSRMDVKEESVECSWPIIYYVIDDFEDMFEHLMVQGQEYLCVELAVALPNESDTVVMSSLRGDNDNGARPDRPISSDHHINDGLQVGKPFPTGSIRGLGTKGVGNGHSAFGVGSHGKITLFQGAASFQSLASIYQQKAASKVAKRFKLGPRKVPQEFVMMRGPGGRGHAQVAITASDRLDDYFPNAGANLTSASETHLSRYQQGATNGAPLSTSPPLSNSAYFSRSHQQQQQQHHYDEKQIPSSPEYQHSGWRKSLDKHGRPQLSSSPPTQSSGIHGHQQQQQQHRWVNGSHSAQAATVRQHSNHAKSQHPPISSSSSFFAFLSSSSSTGPGPVSSPPPPSPPPKLSPTRSFSTGSFFNSLRRLSLATFAHATGNQQHHSNNQMSSSPPLSPHAPASLSIAATAAGLNGSRPRLHSFPQQQIYTGGHEGTRTGMGSGDHYYNHYPPNHEYSNQDSDDTPASSIRSGISSQGTGSRQEIEALVRDPKSLKCCMTFVNVPWTAIATTLMDFAYQQYPQKTKLTQ